MKKENFIKKYGEKKYQEQMELHKVWVERHPVQFQANVRKQSREQNHKGDKFYAAKLRYKRTGTQGKRSQIRTKHGNFYRVYKQIIAPESQIHHEWIPGTPNFRGVALVEKDKHLHGFIDVIRILEGVITLLTEAEIREVVK